MPLYEYRCGKCHLTTEQQVPMTASSSPISCPDCGYEATRVYSAPAIHFKGTGFHNTDYKNKSAKDKPKDEKSPQEVKKDADKTGHTDKPSSGDSKPTRKTDS